MGDSDEEPRYPSKHYPFKRQEVHNYPTSSSISIPPKRNPHFYNTHLRNEDFSPENDEDLSKEEGVLNNSSKNPSGHYYLYNEELKKHPKKRRLGELVMPNYEFAPRSVSNLGRGVTNAGSSRRGWSERESFLLLEVWGERYMELGRRSLRGEDWVDVAEKVTEMSGVERDVMECRNQLDVLKKKYKKERAKMEEIGGEFVSKWVFFKKMDVLLNLRMRGHCGLGCGVDSGEYVFMNPRVYLDRSNVLDEMMDSPAESDEDYEDEEEEGVRGGVDQKSAKILADSIQKFGEIYEKIETSKRKQMMELERMRRDFQRDLELQKKEIVERALYEIAQLKDIGSSDDNDDDDDDDDETQNRVLDASCFHVASWHL
ncbi:DNA-binding transcription factor [Lithospermum erythrorhizon]|uniref:DNA-binding transcription factor n=1 Tax=Lithospermum erythrorhizon TaxID=34254 RepID=A0AAV3RGA4_LITER